MRFNLFEILFKIKLNGFDQNKNPMMLGINISIKPNRYISKILIFLLNFMIISKNTHNEF